MSKSFTFIIAMICTSIIGRSQMPSFDLMVGKEKITTGCVGVTITMRNTSSDTTHAFHWDINGFRINSTSTIYIFLKEGTYPIKLTDEKNNLSLTKNFVINPLPSVSFTSSSNSICAGNTVSFTSTSKGPASILNYYWNFQDENIVSNTVTTNYTFNSAGTKKVLLFVKDGNGCFSPTSSPTQIKVNGTENVSFSTQNGLYYSCDNTIVFNNTSENTGNFNWDFGDGNNYAGSAAPSHTYAKPGVYTVNLIKNEANGNTCTPKFSHKIYVGKPNLQIVTVDSICSATTFNINAYDADNNFTLGSKDVTWTSLDGNFISDSTALSYSQAGIYTLSAVNNIGCPSPTSKNIKALKTPSLKYAISPTGSMCNIMPITFTAESDVNTKLKWHLGDGTIQTIKNNDTIIHVYGKVGTYNVYVEAINNTGCNATSPTQTLTLTDNCIDKGLDSILNPIFKFTSSCDNKYLVTFEMRNSKKAIESITIDGTTYSFTNGKTTIQLPFKGKGRTYTVLVKFSDGTYDYAREISIIDETANFSITNNDNSKLNCAQNNYTFSTETFVNKENISAYHWQIKDLSNDSIVYKADGSGFNSLNYFMPYASTFQINLSIEDLRTPACISTISQQIKVNGPVGNFASLSDSIFCNPQASIAIKNNSIIDKNKFQYMIWDFGDGTTKKYNSIPDTTMHFYKYTGTSSSVNYNVNLKIVDTDGCTSNITATSKYKLYNPTLAAIPSLAIYCNSSNIKVDNRSSVSDVPLSGFTWQFDNNIQHLSAGESFISPKPNVSYPSSYDVKLKVNYGNGIACQKDTTFVDLIKFDKPKATFSILDSELLDVCPPYILHLENKSSGYQSLQWTLSDSIYNTSIKDTMLYYVEKPSNYSIKLRLNGYDNCYDSTYFAFVSKGPKATLTNSNYRNCVPTTTTLTLNSKDPIENYLWAFGDGSTNSSPTASEVSHQYQTSGTYTPSITIIGTVESGHCFNNLELALPIVVDEKVNLDYQKNYSYCLGDSSAGLKLEVDSKASPTYTWYTDDNANGTITTDNTQKYIVIKPTQSTIYHVIAKSSNTCPDESGSIAVTTHESPIVKIPNNNLTIAAGTIFTPNPVIQSSYSDLKYTWSPSTRVSNAYIQNPEIISDNNIVYNLKVQNSFGCSDVDSLNISTLCSSSKIMIPTGFTPNGDGKNDIFYVKGYGIKLVNHFIVVDRWGKTVFERNNVNANDMSNGWDGKVENISAASGTYVYFANVTCNEGNIIPLKGTVVLIR